MAVKADWGVVSHTGTRRSVNQDAVLSGPRIFAVADGMGGHQGGDVAAAIAVAHLASVNVSEVVDGDRIVAALQVANEAILSQAAGDERLHGMGTTVTGFALVAEPSRVFVFNVGDSRVYRLANGDLAQLSVDHSVVAELLRDGEITPEQAGSHPERHVITNALGSALDLQVDQWLLPVELVQRFLVCSDGLTNELDDEALRSALSTPTPPQATADLLLELALTGGARDNVSALVVDVVDQTGVARSDELDDDTNPRPALSEGGPS